jgi:hypothetical protein
LASIDPLAGEGLAPLTSESRPDELLQAILTSRTGEPSAPKWVARRSLSLPSWRGRLVIAAPLAAAVLLASVVGIPGGGKSSSGTLPALARVAEAAAAQPAPNTDLPYRYVKIREINTSVANGRSWSVYQPSLEETWIAKDGSGRVRRILAPPTWVSQRDREAWEAAGRIEFLAFGWSAHFEEEDVRAGRFGQLYGGAKLSELPTEPTELAAWLEARVTDPKANAGAGNGFSVSVRTLTLASEILDDPLAGPELRAALYEAEGFVSGIEYFGKATDAIGRPGVAIGAESANSGAPTRYSLIFDPGTSQVLATEETRLRSPAAFPDAKASSLIGAKLFIESGGASSLGERPRAERTG